VLRTSSDLRKPLEKVKIASREVNYLYVTVTPTRFFQRPPTVTMGPSLRHEFFTDRTNLKKSFHSRYYLSDKEMVITCHLRGCVPFFYPDVQRYPIKQGFAVLQPPRTLKIIHRLLIVWFDRNKKTPNVYTTKSPLYHVRCTIACLGQVATAPSQTASERESFGSGCRSATTSARSKMTDLQRVGEVFTIVAR